MAISASLGFKFPDGWLWALCKALHKSYNHSSGNLNPSQPNIDLTRKIKTRGQILDIGVSDHIILTGEGFYSFADEGMM
jgi:DNA repair protein RadC